MGDPKKPKKKYQTPIHPWQKSRIEEEKKLGLEYGLRRKNELWKASYLLRNFKSNAKRLTVDKSEQGKKEKSQIILKLINYGFLRADKETASFDDILAMEVTDILKRRLQTIVVKKGMANSILQARQFITHGHIVIDDHAVCVPSYYVRLDEEDKIFFNPKTQVGKIIEEQRQKELEKEKIIEKEKPDKAEVKKEASKHSPEEKGESRPDPQKKEAKALQKDNEETKLKK